MFFYVDVVSIPTPHSVQYMYRTASKCTEYSLPISSLGESYNVSQRKWFSTSSSHDVPPICPKDQVKMYERQCLRECSVATSGGNVKDSNTASECHDQDINNKSVQQAQESVQTETQSMDRTCCVSYFTREKCAVSYILVNFV